MDNSKTAVADVARVVRTGGTLAAYGWDYASRMQMNRHFWDAATALDPVAHDLDEGRRFTLCHPAALVDLLRAAGLRDVDARAIDVPAHFKVFDDYWSPFLSCHGPAPSYAASLSEERRLALRECLRAHPPTDAVSSINLIARAWAVRSVARG